MASNRVRLKDIAEVYGCSINTVSKALRNSEELPESTCKKIQAIAHNMGYIRNRQASSLRSGRSRIIAVIVYDIHNAYFSSLISEIELELRRSGYDMMIFCTQTTTAEKERGIEMIQIALSQSVDGILYFPYWTDQANIQYLESSRVPYVLVGHWLPDTDSDCVRCDDYAGGRLAASHLLALGHKKFVYIAGMDSNSAQHDRESGFRDVLSSAGIPASDVLTIPGKLWDWANENGTVRELLHLETYTAIFTFNDNIAYQIIKHFRNLGIRIPEDVSLVGCDHLRRSVDYLENLTSIACDENFSLARESVQALLNRIQQPDRPRKTTLLPVKLYDEHTTQRPECQAGRITG